MAIVKDVYTYIRVYNIVINEQNVRAEDPANLCVCLVTGVGDVKISGRFIEPEGYCCSHGVRLGRSHVNTLKQLPSLPVRTKYS